MGRPGVGAHDSLSNQGKAVAGVANKGSSKGKLSFCGNPVLASVQAMSGEEVTSSQGGKEEDVYEFKTSSKEATPTSPEPGARSRKEQKSKKERNRSRSRSRDRSRDRRRKRERRHRRYSTESSDSDSSRERWRMRRKEKEKKEEKVSEVERLAEIERRKTAGD